MHPTEARNTPAPGESPRRAAVLIPIVRDREGPSLLMEVRAMHIRQPGEICFPGGRVEEGESDIEAALRETREELGIEPSAVKVLKTMAPEPHADRRPIVPVLAEIESFDPSRLSLRREEVGEVFTLPIAWLLSHEPAVFDMSDPESEALPPKLRRYLAKYDRSSLKRTTPYWEYGPHGIWGLTARLLVRLRNMLRDEANEGKSGPQAI